MFKFNVVFLLAIAFIVTGCDRLTDEDKSKIVFDTGAFFEKSGVSSLNTLIPKSVYITVANKDNTGVQHMQAHQASSMELVVDRGFEKSFQVLAIYEDGPFADSRAFYGTRTLMIDQAEVLVSIDLLDLGPMADGRIGGRILNAGSTSAGPTGPVDIFLRVQAGLPSIFIEKDFIWNGYFQWPGVENTSVPGFEYRFGSESQKISLLGAPKTLFDFTPSPQVVHVSIPRSQVTEGSSAMYARSGELLVFGMWGVGGLQRSDLKVSAMDLSGTLNFRKQLKCSDKVTCDTSVSYIGLASRPGGYTASDLIGHVNELTASAGYQLGYGTAYYAGGDNVSCATEYAECLKFNRSQFDVPYREYDLGNKRDFLKRKFGSIPSECGTGTYPCWGYRLDNDNRLDLLPGVSAGSLKIFYQPTQQTSQNSGSTKDITCSEIELTNLGYQALAGWSLQQNGTQILLPSDLSQVSSLAICGVFAGAITPRPIFLYRHDLLLPIGGYTPPATFNFSPSNSKIYIDALFSGTASKVAGVDFNLKVEFYDSSNNLITDCGLVNPSDIIFQSQGGGYSAFTPQALPACSAGEWLQPVRATITGAPTTVTAVVNGDNGNLITSAATLQVMTGLPHSAASYVSNTIGNMAYNTPYVFRFIIRDYYQNPVTTLSNTDFNLTWILGTQVNFNLDPIIHIGNGEYELNIMNNSTVTEPVSIEINPTSWGSGSFLYLNFTAEGP